MLSTRRITPVLAVRVLLLGEGSTSCMETLAGRAMVAPFASVELVARTSTKLPVLVFAASVFASAVQVIAPVPPTAGVVQVQPAGGVMETKVVPAGVFWVKLGVVAAVGLMLRTRCV